MNIYGIDPGTTFTGLAIIDPEKRKVTTSTLTNKFSSTLNSIPTTYIVDNVCKCIEDGSSVVIEAFVHAGKFVNSESVLLMGALMYALEKKECVINSYQNNTVKKAVTGSGRATKKQVEAGVKLILAEGNYTSDKTNLTSHEWDALAVVLTHLKNTP